MRNLKSVVPHGLLVSACFISVISGTSAVSAASICDGVEADASIAVSVDNIRTTEGNLRVQVYGEDPEEFLSSGKKKARVDVKVTGDTQDVCLPVPAPGSYALVVMHDKNANGKADFFTEGFGFSRNPKLNLAPPDHEEVLINVPKGISNQSVTLNYMFGVDDEKKEKRRRLKRR